MHGYGQHSMEFKVFLGGEEVEGLVFRAIESMKHAFGSLLSSLTVRPHSPVP